MNQLLYLIYYPFLQTISKKEQNIFPVFYQSSMSKIRYFPNRLPQYEFQNPQVNIQSLRDGIQNIIKNILDRNKQLYPEISHLRRIIREYELQIELDQLKLEQLQQSYQHLIDTNLKHQRLLQIACNEIDVADKKVKEFATNREIVKKQQAYDSYGSEIQQKLRNKIYQEVSTSLKNKTNKFMHDMQKIKISKTAEERIDDFMTELLYINPWQLKKQQPVAKIKNKSLFEVGKIAHKRQKIRTFEDQLQNGDRYRQWKKFQRSIYEGLYFEPKKQQKSFSYTTGSKNKSLATQL